VAIYKWDGGSASWNAALPMDAEILMHVLATFFDFILPPVIEAPAAAPAAAGAPGLFSKGFGCTAAASNPFGTFPSAPGTAKPAAKQDVFWRSATELTGFSSRHLVHASAKQRVRSDAVLLRHQEAGTPAARATNEGGAAGEVTAAGREMKRAGARYSVMCDGTEWVVAQGEHNAWEAIVLFLLNRAKRGGFLGGFDLRQEAFPSFMSAVTTQGAARAPEFDSPILRHGLLSVLHPWSQRLEALDLAEVTQALG